MSRSREKGVAAMVNRISLHHSSANQDFDFRGLHTWKSEVNPLTYKLLCRLLYEETDSNSLGDRLVRKISTGIRALSRWCAREESSEPSLMPGWLVVNRSPDEKLMASRCGSIMKVHRVETGKRIRVC